MDALLQLIIPRIPSLDGLQRYQREFTWEGVSYPQEPVTYNWGPQVKLSKSEAQSFIINLLPQDLVDQTWEVLETDNETLDLMEQHFNGEDVDWYGCRPDELLISLLAQSEKWVLIFEPNFDQIDHILRLSPTDAVNKLKSVLNWQNERLGFIAISPE